MTPFEQFFTEHVAPGLPKDFPPQLAAAAKKQLAECWNAALEATQEMLLTCCCGHMRAEHNNELFACQHENCTCIQLCDCWIIVSESKEVDHPGILKKHFDPLYAKQSFTKIS